MPMISVIVPVYKVEAYIHRCIDSILTQSYSDFELILVDDGSPDNCGAICDEYAQKDNRVRVIHQENGGLSAARNAGIEWAFSNSDSQWITFIDSDDWLHPEYLSTLYNAAISSNLSLSICGFVRTSGEEPKITQNQLRVELWNPEDFFVEHNVNAVVAWGKLYQKEFFRTVRYPVGKIHEDEYTTYKLLFATDKVAVIDAPLYYYFQNSNGITGSAWSPKRMDLLSAIEERLDYWKTNQLLRLYHWEIPRYLWHIGDQLHSLSYYRHTDSSSYHHSLTKRMRKALHLGRITKTIAFRGNEHYYERAYPLLMRFYWDFKALQNKISGKK